MTLRNKILFIIIATSYFVAMFFALAVIVRADVANTVEQEIVIGPGQHHVNLRSVKPWIIDDEVVGSVASYVYGDVTTKRPADYWELYDQNGDLVALSWFDEFGIQRSAIDQGILNDDGKLDGIFVLIMAGESM